MPSYESVCDQAVRAAGAVLLEKFGRVSVREKGPADLVTEADFAAQAVCQQIISEAFPDHGFLGEEQGGAIEPTADRPYRWIVDPLDGTTNYVHQVPHFCVSLALERQGELLVGAVFDPVSGECFSATQGEGAWLNGNRIRGSAVVELDHALAATGFPAVTCDDCPDLTLFLRALKKCQSIRRTGSSALNLSYLAAGRFDVTWCFSTKVWDVAAGVLLIREAGGIVSGPDGGPFVLPRAQLLAAANTELHQALVALASR